MAIRQPQLTGGIYAVGPASWVVVVVLDTPLRCAMLRRMTETLQTLVGYSCLVLSIGTVLVMLFAVLLTTVQTDGVDE